MTVPTQRIEMRPSKIIPFAFKKSRSSFSSRQGVGKTLGVLWFLCVVLVPIAHAQAQLAALEEWELVEGPRWGVVVYSSVHPERAASAAWRFRNQLPEQHIEILVMTSSRNAPYRVAIGPFPSLETARDARAQLKGLPRDTWLWEVPLTAFVFNRPLPPRAAVPLKVVIDEPNLAVGWGWTDEEQTVHRPLSEDAPAGEQNPVENSKGTVDATNTVASNTPATRQQTAEPQSTQRAPPRRRGPKSVEVMRLNTSIMIDGVLSEAAWQVPGHTDFLKRLPNDGRPPSEETEVWVAYDDKALYVAARCYDRDPSRIDRTIGRRDSDVESDWFSVSIDTYRDGRSGFFFLVTSGGAIQDGVIFNEVRIDRSWDGIWEHHTAIDSLGWSAELRIPFAHLRFDAEQVWGVNFARGIQRTNEIVALVRGRKVKFFAELTGLQDIRSPVQLEVLPYVVVQANTYEGDKTNPFFPGRESSSRVGGDVKLRLGSSINVDATINPDFGQVEVDPAVINLTAQETFFEEKRPFFLEDAPLFDFGRGRGTRFFHSRRIGQSPRGTPVHQGWSRIPEETRILGAAKLAGKVNDAWSVGWMNVMTAREYARVDSAGVRFRDEVAPLSYYNVMRVRREQNGGKKALGFFASGVLRDLQEAHLQPILNERAFVGGVDGWTFFGKRNWWALEGWASFSHVGGDALQISRLQQVVQRYYQRPDATHLTVDSTATSLSGAAGELRLSKRGGNLQMRAGVKVVTPGFELNDLGFLRQADRLTSDFTVLYGQWRQGGLLNRGFVGITAAQAYDFSWTHLGTSYTLFSRGQFINFWDAKLSATFSPKGLDVTNTRGGPAMEAPAGWSGSASLSTDSSKPVLIGISGDASQYEGGNWSYGLGADLTWRPSTKLTISLSPWVGSSLWEAGFFRKRFDPTAVDTYGIRNILAALSQDYFSTEMRLNWTFTPKLSVQTYFQLYSAKVRYDSFKELAMPASYTFNVYGEGGSTISERDENGGYTVDPDGAGPARLFTLYDANFDFASLRGTTVLRWEYRKGSTLYLAWTHDRFIYEDFWSKPDGGLLSASPFNKFVFKLTFWLNP